MNKRGQVTIFIIVAVIIVVVVALFLLLTSGIVSNPFGQKFDENPESYLQNCIERDVYDTINLISPQGGYLSNSVNKSFKFEEETRAYDISYLCYSHTNGVPCLVFRPFLTSIVEEEIKKGIKQKMNSCIKDLEKKYERAGYDVEVQREDFKVSLVPNRILIDVSEKITLTKAGETNTKGDFKLTIPSTLYELVSLSQDIINQEAKSCDFDFDKFWVLRPAYTMEVFETTDGSKIYTIKYKRTDDWFRFIIRGCAYK